MKARFFEVFQMPYLGVLDILSYTGIIYFFMLPKEQKANINYWLPFTILLFTCSLSYINSIAKEFFFTLNVVLGRSLWQIDIVMGVLTKIVLVLMLASPQLQNYLKWNHPTIPNDNNA